LRRCSSAAPDHRDKLHRIEIRLEGVPRIAVQAAPRLAFLQAPPPVMPPALPVVDGQIKLLLPFRA
jgi:hypothetical protein